ncbi:WXG100 family type VII secretion target [Nocardia stercoris]|uniref:WXG100 family type VII secretion target n=2 Tax=Nocardia stercoris TaxID=2483361 RepID=A0A3M2LDB7_9NOCA|nr:WXG100 family type VII secretion target [Nocardia stercoris]
MSLMEDSGEDSDLSVVPADVQALGKFAYDLADSLQSALKQIGAEVGSLTGGDWTGPAADGFAAGWAECSDGGAKIIAVLEQMASSLGVTAQTYVAQDNQFAGQVSALLDLPPL